MSQLNSPQTSKTDIGPSELRLAPLTKAGLQTIEYNVGATESTSIEQVLNTADAMAGFPQDIVDTAITSAPYTLTASLIETSRRNLNILLGNGVNAYDGSGTDVKGLIDTTSAVAADATSLTFDISFTGTLAPGDTVTIYDADDPTNVNVCVVDTFTAKSGSTPASVTFIAHTPLKANNAGTNVFAAASNVYLRKNLVVTGGTITKPVFFSVRLVRIDRQTQSPIVVDIWKATLTGNTTLSQTVTEFSKPQLQLRLLKPTRSDYAAGGPLAHMAERITKGSVNNTFSIAALSDVATA